MKGPLGICPRVIELDIEKDQFPLFWGAAALTAI